MNYNEVIDKVAKLMYANYEDIVLTKVGSHVVYALLGIGLRVHCFKDKARIDFRGRTLLTVTNKLDYEYVFKVCIDNTNRLETEKFQILFKELKDIDATDISRDREDNPYFDNKLHEDLLNEFERY